MLNEILDNLALALYGRTRSEALNRFICVECGRAMIDRIMSTNPPMTKQEFREYWTSALCPECFNKFAARMEELDQEEVNYDLPDYMDAGDVAIMEGRSN